MGTEGRICAFWALHLLIFRLSLYRKRVNYTSLCKEAYTKGIYFWILRYLSLFSHVSESAIYFLFSCRPILITFLEKRAWGSHVFFAETGNLHVFPYFSKAHIPLETGFALGTKRKWNLHKKTWNVHGQRKSFGFGTQRHLYSTDWRRWLAF